jgi:hypothetical protein
MMDWEFLDSDLLIKDPHRWAFFSRVGGFSQSSKTLEMFKYSTSRSRRFIRIDIENEAT